MKTCSASGLRSSRHLAHLEEAGLVEIEKRWVDKKPQTLACLSGLGREAFDEYWKEMDALRKSAACWRPPKARLVPSPV